MTTVHEFGVVERRGAFGYAFQFDLHILLLQIYFSLDHVGLRGNAFVVSYLSFIFPHIFLNIVLLILKDCPLSDYNERMSRLLSIFDFVYRD